MAVRQIFAPVLSAALAAAIVCAVPFVSSAADNENKAPESKAAPQPKPDLATKVYTNDDLGWRAGTPAAAGEIQPSQTSGDFSAIPASTVSSVAGSAAPVATLGERQSPQWYASEIGRLEEELAGIENKEAALRDFRSSGAAPSSGQAIGLELNAPVEGISTDNLIAQLDQRRRELAQSIDALNDQASANGVSAAAVAQASAAGQPPLSAAKQRDALIARRAQLSSELDQTQAVVSDMQQQAASQGASLQPPTPGFGGNMTTDLQSRLAAQAQTLQNQLNTADGDAHSLSVPPGDLR